MARYRLIDHERAAPLVGKIKPGFDLYAISFGHCSLIEVIECCVNQVGEADLQIFMWTLAQPDVQHLHDLVELGMIRSVKWMIDYSIESFSLGTCDMLNEYFGREKVHASKCHAKMVTIRNERFNLAIRSSMNLNENKRIEYFEISDNADMCERLGELMGYVEETQVDLGEAGISFSTREADFWNLGGKPKLKIAEMTYGKTNRQISYGCKQ